MPLFLCKLYSPPLFLPTGLIYPVLLPFTEGNISGPNKEVSAAAAQLAMTASLAAGECKEKRGRESVTQRET